MSELHKQLYELIKYGTLDEIKEFLANKPLSIMKTPDTQNYNLLKAANRRLTKIPYHYSNETVNITSIWLFIFKYKDIILDIILSSDDNKRLYYITHRVYYDALSSILKLLNRKNLDENSPQLDTYMKILENIVVNGVCYNKRTKTKWFVKNRLVNILHHITNEVSLNRIISTNYFAEFLVQSENNKLNDNLRIFSSTKILKIIYKHHTTLIHGSRYLLMLMLRQNIKIPNNYLLTLELSRLIDIFSCSGKFRTFSLTNNALYIKKIYDILSQKGFDFGQPIIENKTLLEYICKNWHFYYSRHNKKNVNLISYYFDKLVVLESVSKLSIIADQLVYWPILYKLIEHGANISINCKLNQLTHHYSSQKIPVKYILDCINDNDGINGVEIFNFEINIENNFKKITFHGPRQNHIDDNVDDADEDDDSVDEDDNSVDDDNIDDYFGDSDIDDDNFDDESELRYYREDYFIDNNSIISYINSKNIFFLEKWSIYEILSLQIEITMIKIETNLPRLNKNSPTLKDEEYNKLYQFLDHIEEIFFMFKQFMSTYPIPEFNCELHDNRALRFYLIMCEIKYITDNNIDQYRLPLEAGLKEIRECELMKKISKQIGEAKYLPADFNPILYSNCIFQITKELQILYMIWKMLTVIPP